MTTPRSGARRSDELCGSGNLLPRGSGPDVPALRRPRCLRRARLVVIGLLLALLSACSSTTFVYNRLDFLLPWYLERYVDLDREQADWLDTHLEPLLDWHRREELPRYDAFLGELERDLDAPITLALLQRRTDEVEAAWYRTRDRGLDMLLELAEQLNGEQITEFIAELRKRQRKYERKYLDRDEEEFRDDARDSLREMVEDYLGRLTPAQRDLVSETAAALARSDAVWLRERAAWIDTMERILERRDGWQEELRSTIKNWESELDEDTMALYDGNTRLVQELVVAVANARSERQDRRLRRRIASYRDDIATLTATTSAGD